MYTRNKTWIWVYVGFAILALGPLVISLITNSIADLMSCQITPQGTNCPMPDLFYDLGELYWFSYITFPLGVVGIIITGIIQAIGRFRKRTNTHI